MKGLDTVEDNMDRQNSRTAGFAFIQSYESKENSACNSSKFRLKECRTSISRRTVRGRRDDSNRWSSTSQRCRHKNSGTSYSFFYTCLVGMILFTLWTECSARTARDKTPLIVTDASNGNGVRYFMPDDRVSPENLFDGPLGRSPGSLISAPTGLHFQTFKFIESWGNDTDILLLGGKDHVYMLDGKFPDGDSKIRYLERLTWRPQDGPHRECMVMPGEPEEEMCGNFIRFIELMENGELMVCGTNAYSPVCRYYTRGQFQELRYGKDSEYKDEKKCREKCVVPDNPRTASVSLYTNTDNGYQIFAAAINGFMANEPIIMKKHDPTLLSNSLWLNEPTFLKIMEYRDKVYVFFREKVEESESGRKDEVTYARVAQVCKNDSGGINVLADHWTSFLKARLRCGYSEKQHFQFNNLTSVSDILTVSEDTGRELDIFYATFTTPWDWEESSISAVCAFSMEEVARVFEQGRFFGEEIFELRPLSSRETSHTARPSSESVTRITKSYPIEDDLVPNPRPGSCNSELTYNGLYFAKEHPLMYDEVTPLLRSPIDVFHNLRATQIAVDNNAGSSGKQMIYIGTENGKILRLRSMLSIGKHPMAILVETITLETEKSECMRKDCTIRSLHISRPVENRVEFKPSLFIAFTDFVAQIPLARCDTYGNRECCSVDPDCGWNGNQCVMRTLQSSERLSPISEDADSLRGPCGVAGLNEKCDCRHKKSANCENGDGNSDVEHESSVEPEILDQVLARGHHNLDLMKLLNDSITTELRRQFRKTVREFDSAVQQKSLKRQLKEAVASTVGLVLRNHNQEYCLPSLAVNHLTHVYPLLVHEIELWHDMALKIMNETEFDPKCWTTDKECHKRVSFSLPLARMLWEPLSKLIVNFSGRCDPFDDGKEAAAFWPGPRTQCKALPGLEPCKDGRKPHCRGERCQFQEYAIDAKAFFRHADDSRQFLKAGGHLKPLWKAVNITVPTNETIRGHLEVVVSKRQAFLIDYSPVPEKVKIIFHLKAVKDCDLSDPSCPADGCDWEVESIVNHWHNWVVKKLPKKNEEVFKADP